MQITSSCSVCLGIGRADGHRLTACDTNIARNTILNAIRNTIRGLVLKSESLGCFGGVHSALHNAAIVSLMNSFSLPSSNSHHN